MPDFRESPLRQMLSMIFPKLLLEQHAGHPMVEEEKMEISMNLGRKFSQTQASLGFWNDY